MMNIAGPKIKKARKAKGWDQGRLSFVLEDEYNLFISQPDVSEIEHQKRGLKDYELLAFSKALEVQVEWLLTIDDN